MQSVSDAHDREDGLFARGLGRRALLQGALGVAGMGMLAACTGNQATNAAAACISF